MIKISKFGTILKVTVQDKYDKKELYFDTIFGVRGFAYKLLEESMDFVINNDEDKRRL